MVRRQSDGKRGARAPSADRNRDPSQPWEVGHLFELKSG